MNIEVNSRPIRVLHVLGALDRGGAETMVMNLYRNIDRSKIQFDFIIHTEEKCDYTDEIIDLGGKIYSMKKFRGYNLFSYYRQFSIFFKTHNEYKIVHGHMRSTASIYLSIANKNDCISIAHSHNISSGNGIVALIKNVLQYPIRYIANYFFSCSLEAGKWLFGEKVIQSKNFYIIKNGIDIKRFLFNENIRQNKRKELGITDQFVIGNVARFHEQKNHEFLIDLFKEYLEVNLNSLLILVGEGALRESIKIKVNNLGLQEKVIFLDSREDINELMQAFDVFVFPSKYEGLGIVAIEAQCSSLPVLCSNNIPKEVKISNNITFLSIQDVNEWVLSLEHINNKNRYIENKELLLNSGYNIGEIANKIEIFYLNINNKDRS